MSTESTVKVTYAHKKRRSSAKGGTAEESEGSGSEQESPHGSVEKGKAEGRSRHPGPLDLPGPVPRSKRVGSKEKLGGKMGGSPHAPKTSGRPVKPPSTPSSKISLISEEHLGTPEDNGVLLTPIYDVSDKESGSRAPRTTKAERRAYLESHPDVAGLEPHRVLCRCCNKWLKLGSTQNYALTPWKLHKRACTSEKPCRKKPRRGTDRENISLVSGAEDDDASSIGPSISASDATGVSAVGRHCSLAERRRLLEEDELSGEVRSDAVYCSVCAKWVRLSARADYQLKNWMTHAERVHGRHQDSSKAENGGGTPSTRVREAERKLQLVNDSQALDLKASRVICKACAAEVALSETVPYQLDNWLAHRAACPAMAGSGKSQLAVRQADLTEEPTSKPVSTTASKMRAPSSIASTDATCVAAESATDAALSLGESAVGKKRQRDGDEDSSKAVRARTGSYSVSDASSEGLWGWLKVPWETFKRGFAEGIGAARGDSSKTDE